MSTAPTPAPQPISSLAPIAAACTLVPLAAEALWLHLHWSQIPTQWPRHWSVTGQPNGYGTNSPIDVYLPLALGAWVSLTILLILVLLHCGSGPQATQRRRTLPPLAALSWLLAALFCLLGLLPLTPHVTPKAIVTTSSLFVAAAILLSAWLTLSNRSTRTRVASEFWHFAIFYYNPADPALLVPKRLGWGWTLNYGRPSAWALTAAILLAALFPLLLPHLTK